MFHSSNKSGAPQVNLPPRKKTNVRCFVPTSHERGFALVTALLLLPMLAILVIGLIGLSAIETRKSTTQLARIHAQANARLALQFAVGDLQKHLGPDQRVSTDSRILEKNVSGSSASKLQQPHWTNVWKTTREDGTPVIVRDAERGGLSDTRNNDGWNADNRRIACLVSGNEESLRYMDGPSPSLPEEEEMIELVGDGSVSGDAENDKVSAPRVDLHEGEKVKGSYAWWVGDLGIKANVATRDLSQNSRRSRAELEALLLSQDASLSAAGGPDLANAERDKMVTQRQLGLTGSNSASLDKRSFHDLTTDSLGLLVDVREGGLKKDLTAFLLSGGSISDLNAGSNSSFGVRDSDNLVGPRNKAADSRSESPGQADRFSEVSPDFGLLRDWALRADDAPFGTYTASADYAQRVGRATNGWNKNPTKFENRAKTDLTPVLVESSIYYNVSYYTASPPDARNPYGLRVHLYPRVALWNPYNFSMKVDPSMIYMQINGNKIIEVTMAAGRKQSYRMYWGLTGGSQRGSIFFKMGGATLAPGETVVWSPESNRPYDETIFSNNVLSPGATPSPTRSFYQDKRIDNTPLFQIVTNGPLLPGMVNNRCPAQPVEWREFVPAMPGGNLQANGYTQSDDYVMLWKPLTGSGGNVNLDTFSGLPQGRFVSCAYQYGDEDELPVEWSYKDPVPFPMSSLANPAVNQIPDRRTRDGFRLRWSEEHQSNRMGSGSLAGTAHLECSPVANWNMRASYAFRNPFDNVTDVAPHFFGIYTRDLFDAAVGWNEMAPRFKSGQNHGDPFDQPIRFSSPRILFDVPRRGTEIASLGALQHVNFSEFIWHPTYALGNSLADPRIELTCTEPKRTEEVNANKGGWNQDTIGYALDGRSDPNGNAATTREDNWAYSARSLLQQKALDQTLIYDLSYELNHSLWDEFFLSSGTPQEKMAFQEKPDNAPLPNGRMKLYAKAADSGDKLLDFHRAASELAVDGAFNVNSTSVAAWEAMLLSNVGSQFGDKVAFPRILNLPGGEWDGKSVQSEGGWTGQRTFTRAEIHSLAVEIVNEVKSRGPFISLGDFVNRRLRNDESGKKGALQAAIDKAGLNERFESEWPLDNTKALPSYQHMDHIKDPTRLEQTNQPSTTAWGALGFLTQADVLQFLGPALTARSDTFVVRAYGSCQGADGEVEAEAWCEAVVQRSPAPLNPDQLGLNPQKDANSADFGRRFEVKSFRWLSRDEV